MKPQFLQDAIKSAALKKAQKREAGTWKEPVVRQHKVTAEDLAREKTSSSRPAVPSSGMGGVGSSGIPVTTTMTGDASKLLQQMQQERQSWLQERDALLKEMKALRVDMQNHSKEMDDLRREMKTVKAQASANGGVSTSSSQQREEDMAKQIKAIRSELSNVMEQVDNTKSTTTTAVEKLRKDMLTIKNSVAASGSSQATSAAASDVSDDVEALEVEVDKLKREMKELKSITSITGKEAKVLRDEMNDLKSSGDSLTELKDLRREVAALRKNSASTTDLDKLREEVATMQISAASTKTIGGSAPSVTNPRRESGSATTTGQTPAPATWERSPTGRNPSPSARRPSGGSGSQSNEAPKTPSSSTSNKATKAKISTDRLSRDAGSLMTPHSQLASPVKISSTGITSNALGFGKASHKPHTGDELHQAQRKDSVLKQYLKTKVGLPFRYKDLSIPEFTSPETGEVKHLVMFENRFYIPEKLRSSTLQYIVQKFPYDSVSAMEQHYIWPNCIEELKEFKKNNR